MTFLADDCARTRESISAQLDGELPELERWQRAHLRVCADCSAWAEDVESATLWLRAAPLEEPAVGFARPRARRTRGTAHVALVAAAAASLVAVLGSYHSLVSNQPARSSDPAAGERTGGQWPRGAAVGSRQPGAAGVHVRLAGPLPHRLATDVPDHPWDEPIRVIFSP